VRQPPRGEALNWLLDEFERTLRSLDADRACALKAGEGKYSAEAERFEVDGILQLAAFRAGVPLTMLTRDQARAAFGLKREGGAWKTLLAREDVAARSSVALREQYLFATAARL
jgi:hypothetical protein